MRDRLLAGSSRDMIGPDRPHARGASQRSAMPSERLHPSPLSGLYRLLLSRGTHLTLGVLTILAVVFCGYDATRTRPSDGTVWLLDAVEGLRRRSAGDEWVTWTPDDLPDMGLGIALDGDGDRVVMVDDAGELVDGDQLIHILAVAAKEAGTLQGPVVGTVMSNLGLQRSLEDRGIEFLRAPVGDRLWLAPHAIVPSDVVRARARRPHPSRAGDRYRRPYRSGCRTG